MGTVMIIGPCVLFAFSGLGLLRRKQSGRRLNIGVALLWIGGIGHEMYIVAPDFEIALLAMLMPAVMLLVLMFLPSVRVQFMKEKSTKME